MQVYILHAEHFRVPGVKLMVFKTEAAAAKQAVEFTNMMLEDFGWQREATPANWERHLQRLQDEHGAQHCFVEISKVDVQE